LAHISPSDPIFALARSMSPNSTPDPPRKKKQYRYGPRDSLRSRLKVGSPGSSRHRRWTQQQELILNLSESESDLSDGELDFEESAEPAYGAFAAYFYDHSIQRALQPFLDITEEQQNTMIGYDDERCESPHSDDPMSMSPVDSFNLLQINKQRVLRKHCHDNVLRDLDNIIFQFCSNDSTQMTIALESSFSRLLIHASAEFYGLVSFSRRSPTGKTTFIQKRSGFSAPGLSLFEFLSTQHGPKEEL